MRAEDCFDKVGEDGKRGVTDCRGFSSNGRYEQALPIRKRRRDRGGVQPS